MDGDGGRLDDPLRGVPDAPQRQGGHLQGEQEKASGGVDLPWQTCLRVRIRELKKVLRPLILIYLILSFICYEMMLYVIAPLSLCVFVMYLTGNLEYQW